MSLRGGLYDNFHFLPYGRGSPTFRGPGGDQNSKWGAHIWWGCLLHLGSPYIRFPACAAKKAFFLDAVVASLARPIPIGLFSSGYVKAKAYTCP